MKKRMWRENRFYGKRKIKHGENEKKMLLLNKMMNFLIYYPKYDDENEKLKEISFFLRLSLYKLKRRKKDKFTSKAFRKNQTEMRKKIIWRKKSFAIKKKK